MPLKKEIFFDGPASTQIKFYDTCMVLLQQKKNILTKILQSTREYHIKNKKLLEYVLPDQEPIKIYKCGAVLTPFTPKDQGYSDLIGRFTIKLSRGKIYMLVI